MTIAAVILLRVHKPNYLRDIASVFQYLASFQTASLMDSAAGRTARTDVCTEGIRSATSVELPGL